MIVATTHGEVHYIRRDIDKACRGLGEIEDRHYDIQRQLVYNANAANDSIDRIQDAFEFFRDRISEIAEAASSGCGSEPGA